MTPPTSACRRDRARCGDHDAARNVLSARVRARPGVVVIVGDVDTGKTTVARELLRTGLHAGAHAAWLDTDLGQSTVGPPTTLGLRTVADTSELSDPVTADRAYFVGSVTPRGSLLPIVAGAARLLPVARRSADLVVVDTSGFTTGPAALRLKFHLLELAAPTHVVGLQRDGEIEPLLTLARRFTAAETHAIPVHPAVVSRSHEQRARARRDRLASYFAGARRQLTVPLDRCMPPVPDDVPQARLDRLLVGLDDGRGRCLGLGLIEHDGGQLWVRAHRSWQPPGLRLGSIRVDADWWTHAIHPGTIFEG